MGPTWVLSVAPDGPHVGPMDLAIRDQALPEPIFHPDAWRHMAPLDLNESHKKMVMVIFLNKWDFLFCMVNTNAADVLAPQGTAMFKVYAIAILPTGSLANDDYDTKYKCTPSQEYIPLVWPSHSAHNSSLVLLSNSLKWEPVNEFWNTCM